MKVNYFLKSVLTLVLFAASFLSFQAKADAVVINGVAYDVLNAEAKTAQVVALPGGAKYTGTLTIAANITIAGETYAVKKIGDGSLRDAPELTAVIIPEGLEIIGHSSFASCSAITELQLQASVNSIEEWAFYGCSGLTSINIPDGVSAINEHTFQNSGLTSVELPASVTSLKGCAFQDASQLETINLENIREIDSWALYGTAISSVELIDVPLIKRWTFPVKLENFSLKAKEVTEFRIEGWAFQNSDTLKSVVLPDGLTVIEEGLFSGCRLLETLTIPSSVREIKAWALEKTGLKLEVYISWESTESLVINDYAFGENTDKADLVWKIHFTLAESYGDEWQGYPVKQYALVGDVVVVDGIAYKVTDTEANTVEVAALPDGGKYTGTIEIAANITIAGETYAVKKIGDGSLRDAPELTAVIIPEGLETIGNSSFASCSAITELQLPASVNSIEDWAFYGCSGLTSINIPDGVSAINAHTFQYAGLTSVELPASVTALKGCAFQDASKLETINLENIREIGGWALYGTAIPSVELIDVPVIESEAFRNCPNLVSFTLRKEAATEFKLNGWVFTNSTKLATVNLPEGVTYMDEGVFSGCSALETLTIPNSVNTIKNWAFEKSGLKRIHVSWPELESLTIGDWTFGSDNGKIDFVWVVPVELAEVYGDTWKGYPVIVEGTGINYIPNATIKLINENHAIRIEDDKNLSGTVHIYSVNGVKQYTRSGRINGAVVELPAGIYVVKITSSEGIIISKMIVK